MEFLENVLLQALGTEKPVKVEALETLTARHLGRPVDSKSFTEALNFLEAQCLVSLTGSEVRRTEPDFPERVLEDPAEDFLASTDAFQALRLERDYTVMQRTARGGRAGTGIWSRPDFTFATIRRRKYDPVRHLDVIAVELKNLAGTSVVAVHEALAHTRFAHYAYLICPRSKISKAVKIAIEDSCSQHGVGLITFDIMMGADKRASLKSFEFEVEARRKSPEPEEVDNYIDDRLDEQNKAKLMRLAGTN